MKQGMKMVAGSTQECSKVARRGARCGEVCLQRVDGIDALADLLSCLSPAVLSKVAVTSHGSMAAGDMRALLRFPRLQVCSLQLRGVAATLPANASWVLGQLRCLQAFTAVAGSIPEDLPAALAPLTQLTAIMLHCRKALPDVQPLLALTAMPHLCLKKECGTNAGLGMLPGSAFPARRSATFQSPRLKVGNAVLHACTRRSRCAAKHCSACPGSWRALCPRANHLIGAGGWCAHFEALWWCARAAQCENVMLRHWRSSQDQAAGRGPGQ